MLRLTSISKVGVEGHIGGPIRSVVEEDPVLGEAHRQNHRFGKEKSGPKIRYRDGKTVLDHSPGRGGSHGPQHEFQVVVRDRNHAITAGLPEKWMHAKDELYSELRGPAKNVAVLATAYADPAKRGTGEHEPMLMTIAFGAGRVFHIAYGHAGPQCRSVAFIVPFQRGAEWAASGKVTQKIPADMPGPEAPVLRK